MSLTRIFGCKITDIQFTLDDLDGNGEITWNVTRLQRDAERGLFGKPHRYQIEALPPMTDAARNNIDWDKVDKIMLNQDILASPVIAIGSSKPGYSIWCFVDGNHRLCARQLMRFTGFEAYVVPPEIEQDYRITTIVEDHHG